MNAREKLLAGIVGGVVGLALLAFGVRAIVIAPLRDLDKRIGVAREKIGKIQTQRRAYFAAEERLGEVVRRTFADTVDEAGARSGEMLTRQILAAGLRETGFTRTPVSRNTVRGAKEIGWNVQGDGPLTNIVNLLYLLDRTPWVHRTENLSIAAGEVPGTVRARFSYLTLVVDPAPEVQRTNLVATATLEDPARHLLNSIVSRDIFRPYMRRPATPPQPGQPAAPFSRPGVPPGPENFRVVSLSEWDGQPEIHVRDLAGQKTLRFRPGDELAGGVIALVDYRPLPRPDNALLQSYSRVILRIGTDYWAIERGRTLADKRKLAAAELPPGLAAKP
ncbi:MAG: hypothetical protein DVB31_09860 [Verrucomicrobia bacterium]|nr:MAG: hypothetical protein DVB31_09860 [Verrucomicrobiota bacterium]